MQRESRWLLFKLLCDFLLMLLLFGLDVRDLWFKTAWIGPHDTFSFHITGTQPLHRNLLSRPAAHAIRSGWGSFLDSCQQLSPFTDSDFFLHAMGANCTVGPPSTTPFNIDRLVITGSMRVDSIAWAACQLLRDDRKPGICQNRIVKAFSARYNIAETLSLVEFSSRTERTTVMKDPESLAADFRTVLPNSPAETELLELLRMISQSSPLGSVVCVEGFKFGGPGHYTPTIYGCGNPTRLESAFVGHHAAAIPQLLQNKAWITSDLLYFLGMKLLIRQNSRSFFHVQEEDDGTLWLEHATQVNFSSSGILYVVLIFIDGLLLFIGMVSTLEMVSLIFWPSLKELFAREDQRIVGTSQAPFPLEDYMAVLTCSLMRSSLVTPLMLVSQVLWWLVILPNDIIWTWTTATDGKIQAFFSSVRIWVLPVIIISNGWNVLVGLFERHAYALTRRTYVSLFEIGAVVLVVLYVRRESAFSIGGLKYALDGQRLTDSESFPGFLAFANGYPETLDTTQVSDPAVAGVIYKPLGEIVGWSVFGSLCIVLVRLVYNILVYTVAVSRKHPSERAFYPPTPSSLKETRSTPAEPTKVRGTQKKTSKPYARLPLEDLLDLPVRARSLVRNEFRMETQLKNQTFLRPAVYVEHGVVMEMFKLRTRQGFYATIQCTTETANHCPKPSQPPDTQDPAASLRQERPVLQLLR